MGRGAPLALGAPNELPARLTPRAASSGSTPEKL